MNQPKYPNDSYFASLSEYEQWLGEVYEAIESRGVTRSDAQGIVEAQHFETSRQWGLGAEPSVAAGFIFGDAPADPPPEQPSADRPKG